MKDIPKPVFIVLGVVVLLFVLITAVGKRSGDDLQDDPQAARDQNNWVGGIGADNAIDLGDILAMSDCGSAGNNLRVSGSCEIKVPPTTGLLRRVTFRSFELRAVGDETMKFQISSIDISKLDLDTDSEIRGTITNDADDEGEKETMTVGVPPGGLVVLLSCPGFGPGQICLVGVR